MLFVLRRSSSSSLCTFPRPRPLCLVVALTQFSFYAFHSSAHTRRRRRRRVIRRRKEGRRPGGQRGLFPPDHPHLSRGGRQRDASLSGYGTTITTVAELILAPLPLEMMLRFYFSSSSSFIGFIFFLLLLTLSMAQYDQSPLRSSSQSPSQPPPQSQTPQLVSQLTPQSPSQPVHHQSLQSPTKSETQLQLTNSSSKVTSQSPPQSHLQHTPQLLSQITPQSPSHQLPSQPIPHPPLQSPSQSPPQPPPQSRILPTLGQGPVPLCSPDSIGLLLFSPAPHSPTLLFAHPHPDLAPCSQPFPPGSPLLRLEVPLRFMPCGVTSRRLTHPRIGLEHSLRAVLNFNANRSATTATMAQLERRVFDVRCQYFPDRNQSIGRVLELSAHQSTFLVQDSPLEAMRARFAASGAMLQPECKYSIHTNSLDGPSVAKRVQLGDRLFHRWRCGDDYALKVYRCFVHDGRGTRHQIINDRGCSMDQSLMPHPMYSANASHAVAASRVFRFASSTRVFFDCLLYACLKNDPECRRTTDHRCDNSGAGAAVGPRLLRKRRKRRAVGVTITVSGEGRGDGEGSEFIFATGEEMVTPSLPLPSSSSASATFLRQEVSLDSAEEDKELRRALMGSQRLVKALAILNLASLTGALLLGLVLCRRRRRFASTLSIAQR